MEISAGKKHVAVIERCMMSEAGLRHLFASPAMKSYHFHFFNSHKAFVEAQKKTPFFSVIYSLSSMRELRRECLLCLHALSLTNPASSGSYWRMTIAKRALSAVFLRHDCMAF
jgi:hypothetical protein